jgi:copper chaperone CopZ
MNSLMICSDCQDKDKEKLTKVEGKTWLCDDCAAERDAIIVYMEYKKTPTPQHAKVVDTK